MQLAAQVDGDILEDDSSTTIETNNDSNRTRNDDLQ